MESLGPADADVESLVRAVQIPSLNKPSLQQICAVNSISKTGTKNDLQKRIIQLVRECAAAKDLQRFNEVRQSVYSHSPGKAPPMSSATSQSPASYQSQSVSLTPSGYAMGALSFQHVGSTNGLRPPSAPYSQSFQYKPDPFYEIKARIGDVKTLEVMAQHRHTVKVYVKASDHGLLQQCSVDSNLRVKVFCAASNTGVQDIAFPYQSELKVNSVDIKASLRGLKNKPGSTRPVDITSSLRLKPQSYNNEIEYTYALTSKAGDLNRKSTPHRYYFGVYICREFSVPTLVEQIQRGKKIPKASVVLEIAKKASDPDVVATSQNLSLSCPLTMMRLEVPCRAFSCSHIQCFDATAYLQLQLQGPQWICPICNKSAPFNQLAVDEYVLDILSRTPKSLEQVTIEPEGNWLIPAPQRSFRSDTTRQASLVDDDDLADLSYANGTRNTVTPNRQSTVAGTPLTASSRESSAVARPTTAGTKRTSEVIDLTLSDDDDEPLSRPPSKRLNSGVRWSDGTGTLI